MEAYQEQITQLKFISYDSSHDEYMTDSLCEVYNFDAIKTQYANSLGLTEEVASSCDGLFWSDKWRGLIEFKNGKDIKSNEIKFKILNSLLILCDINNINVSDTRSEMEFILVYNSVRKPITETEINQYKKDKNDIIIESGSKDYICKHISKKANTEYRRFGLSAYVGLYFKDVHTYDIEEFKSWLVKSEFF
ncbi:hypothetical protein DWZ94_07485 [Veillonella atypica]|uniref:hypothetical protein n=1 Tax=Veillonella atypica TaxID=39777 RepID=UPI000E482B05|nr:hypothetical protein [Veillonella atypica]RHL90196.1 hypothetical protein DWZ94_07485 [Veillonella atypica]